MTNHEMIERFFALLQAVNRYVRSGQFEREDRDKPPVTRVQWLILRHLHRQGERSVGQLAEHLNVRSSTMSQMLDRLEKTGLVYRATGSPDGRARFIGLTAAGQAVIREMESRFMEKLAEPFAALTPADHRQLILLLEKLTQAFPKRGE